MADLDKTFTSMISGIHKSVLKPRGFQKDGQTMRKIVEGSPVSRGMLFNFQKSQWNDRSSLSFTINTAKKSAVHPQTIDPKFKEYECFPDARRPGELIPDSRTVDKWWTITEETDMDALRDELCEFLTKYALPWLET